MALTIAHKQAAVGQGFNIVQALYNYINGLPAQFTIIDQAGLGANDGWFVFKPFGGTWECWIGSHSGGSAWAGANTLGGSAAGLAWRIAYAFAPAGGWDAVNDDPGGTMFSLSAVGGTWWNLMRSCTGPNYFTNGELHWFTVWDDPATQMFGFLIDKGRDNSWNDGMLIADVTSRFSGSDPTPYVVLGGAPQVGANAWLYLENSAISSALLLPGDATQGYVVMDGGRTLNATNQPNPITNEYDLEQFAIRTDTPGIKHNRGLIKSTFVRQCSTALGERTMVGDGNLGTTWIVPYANGGLALPWDGGIVL